MELRHMLYLTACALHGEAPRAGRLEGRTSRRFSPRRNII